MAENPAQPVSPTQIAENIGIATISKPPVNPLSSDVCDGLLESFDEFEKAQVRVVIIRADPNTKIWSAGHDVHEIPLDGHDAVHWTTGFVQVLQRVRYCPMPVIAMLHSSVWARPATWPSLATLPSAHPRRRSPSLQSRSDLLQHRGHVPLPRGPAPARHQRDGFHGRSPLRRRCLPVRPAQSPGGTGEARGNDDENRPYDRQPSAPRGGRCQSRAAQPHGGYPDERSTSSN